MLKIDDHDNAIIGPAYIWGPEGIRSSVLVYDAEVIRENLVRQGMTSEDAREFIEFNIEDAYMGAGTPVLVWPQDEWSDDE